MMLKEINKHIFFTAINLIFIIALFEYTSLDIYIQNFFFQIDTQSWLLNRDEPILKFILYDGIKRLLIIFAVSILFTLLIFRKEELIKKYKTGLIIVLLSTIIVPLSVGYLKATTNTPCPKNIEYYGGEYPDIKVFENYPKEFVQKEKIKCWPAGHASGGFALMALFFLFKKRRNQILGLCFGLSIGWCMGLYKMLIGDHFLSHTIVTMVLAWFIILILVKILQRKEIEKSTQI